MCLSTWELGNYIDTVINLKHPNIDPRTFKWCLCCRIVRFMTNWALSCSVVNILGTTGIHLVEKLKAQSKAQLHGPTFTEPHQWPVGSSQWPACHACPMQGLGDEAVGIAALPQVCRMLFLPGSPCYIHNSGWNTPTGSSGIHSPWLYSKISLYGLCCWMFLCWNARWWGPREP